MKTIFENSAQIIDAGINLNRSSAAEGLPIPLHPGAEKFLFD
jgi:TRAP-type uncharacterized transport system substrate-binding protein